MLGILDAMFVSTPDVCENILRDVRRGDVTGIGVLNPDQRYWVRELWTSVGGMSPRQWATARMNVSKVLSSQNVTWTEIQNMVREE